jgi:UDP-N-acetylglucosamine 2-epimerase (non-hydrolysing)
LLDDDAARLAMSRRHNPYGDGHASQRIAGATLAYFGREPLKAASFAASFSARQ